MADDPVTGSAATRFERIEPILSVRDIEASLAYYRDVLGFEPAPWGGTFTHVSRDGCGIYLCEGEQGQAGTWVWVGVEDVDALYAQYRSSGAWVVMEPTTFEWAREMRIQDPDGHVLRFGSDPYG